MGDGLSKGSLGYCKLNKANIPHLSQVFPLRASQYSLSLVWISRHRTIQVHRAEVQPSHRRRRFHVEELLFRVNRVRVARNFNRIFEDMAEGWAAVYGPDSYNVMLAWQAAHIAAAVAEYRMRELLEMLEDGEE